MLYKFYSLLLLFTISFIAYSQDYVDTKFMQNADVTYEDEIRTVTLRPVSDPYGLPIIKFNSPDVLVLDFDQLDDSMSCNSALAESDFDAGFCSRDPREFGCVPGCHCGCFKTLISVPVGFSKPGTVPSKPGNFSRNEPNSNYHEVVVKLGFSDEKLV